MQKLRKYFMSHSNKKIFHNVILFVHFIQWKVWRRKSHKSHMISHCNLRWRSQDLFYSQSLPSFLPINWQTYLDKSVQSTSREIFLVQRNLIFSVRSYRKFCDSSSSIFSKILLHLLLKIENSNFHSLNIFLAIHVIHRRKAASKWFKILSRKQHVKWEILNISMSTPSRKPLRSNLYHHERKIMASGKWAILFCLQTVMFENSRK